MIAKHQCLLVAVLAAVTTPICAETYKDPSGFSFDYPAGWVALSGRDAQPDSAAMPKELREWMSRNNIDLSRVNAMLIREGEDDFLENLNVVVEQSEIPATEKSAKELTDVLPKQFRSMGAEVNGFEAKVGELSGQKLIYASFGSKLPGVPMPLRTRQYYIPGGGKTYIVTITMQEATNKKYAPVFAKVMDSFKVPPAKGGGFQFNRAVMMGIIGGVIGGIVFMVKKLAG